MEQKEFKDCKNSSGKVFGQAYIDMTQIIIKHNTKPELIITDKGVIEEVLKRTDKGIILLYDKYFLSIGEIAALYDVCYANINRRKLPFKTSKNEGRRNATFGTHHSEETKKKIGEKSKGRVIPQYERTAEIREKISQGLKKYYQENGVSEETRKKLSQAWGDGKYQNSPMGTGIHGYFNSIKNNKKFYFRSLLELKYMLILEEQKDVLFYQIEPFQIKIEDNIHHYTPDFLINNKEIIELKPKNHLTYTKENDRFQQEITAAKSYAKDHNMIFKIVYDTDIDFESRSFKRWLKNNPNIINQYQITFDRDINKWS